MKTTFNGVERTTAYSPLKCSSNLAHHCSGFVESHRKVKEATLTDLASAPCSRKTWSVAESRGPLTLRKHSASGVWAACCDIYYNDTIVQQHSKRKNWKRANHYHLHEQEEQESDDDGQESGQESGHDGAGLDSAAVAFGATGQGVTELLHELSVPLDCLMPRAVH
jgi:hypothetical protein